MDWKLILITSALPAAKWLLQVVSKLAAALALYIGQLEASYTLRAASNTAAKVQAPSGVATGRIQAQEPNQSNTAKEAPDANSTTPTTKGSATL